ncbi:MAG: class B sortase [Oscillospiraceae bacterium]|nr:class B sortase [Oscillospiraceae bacterium]
MLRSKRMLLAAALLLILCICMAVRAVHRAGIPEQELPELTLSAEPQRTETVPAVTAAPPVTAQTAAETTGTTGTTGTLPVPHADEPELPQWKYEELRKNTDDLAAQLGDLVGWIFMADSDIDYPVMQGNDNFYYLSHAPDGRPYQLGSIMLDYRNDRRFQDDASILYGHNMVSGMFGDIRSFRNQSSFDAHRYGWLFTPDTVYRIDFFALAIVSGYDTAYDLPCAQKDFLTRIRSQAEFDSGAEVAAEDRLIALSTCAVGDPAECRALFTGVLREQGGSGGA